MQSPAAIEMGREARCTTMPNDRTTILPAAPPRPPQPSPPQPPRCARSRRPECCLAVGENVIFADTPSLFSRRLNGKL